MTDTINTQIEAINERLKELESNVPIPASIKPKPKNFSQLEVGLYVWDFVKGSLQAPSRKPYTVKQALAEAAERARKRGCICRFIDWQNPVNRASVGVDDAVVICRELSAITAGTYGGGFAQIREWKFDQNIPEYLLTPIEVRA
jgi:hypothetical protein